MRGVATTVHDILRLNFERRRVVNLLKITREVALVIVLPLDQAADIVGEL